MEKTEELLREISKGLLQWYNFKPGAAAMYIGNRTDALAEMLEGFSLQVVYADAVNTCDEKWQQQYAGAFDYIIAVEALELQPDPARILCAWRGLLKADGRMLLGMNNRFGIRYFCGDRDPYTERNFDGIENYRRAYMKKTDVFRGRCYSRAEIRCMLQDAGWDQGRFFSIVSDLKNPSILCAEDYLPRENLASRIIPVYHYPDAVFLEEMNLYGGLVENGMFHQMANAYLAECAPNGEYSNVLYVTCSMTRGREDAMLTLVHKSGTVEKRAVYPEGRKKLEKLVEHGRDLANHGICVVDARIENESYVMPYLDEEIGHVYLERLLQTDQEKFLQEMDYFRNLILQSSEEAGPENGDSEKEQGIILRRGYLDMVPLNSFHKDGEFVFYDQEFCQENYPANVIIARVISTLYARAPELQNIIPAEEMYGRYGLKENLNHWNQMERDFLGKLLNDNALRPFYEKHRCNGEVLNSNRQRINYSQEDYQRLFIDIFRNADTRKLVLFGSGAFARKFLELYGQDYPVYAVIDNSEDRWGQELKGLTIHSPGLLQQMKPGEYKVLVCIKNYVSVMKQLDDMGVKEYSIFDSHKDYPRKRRPIAWEGEDAGKETGAGPKKYHVGYIAGVFDLYHIGHLNMFKRAKEQCDYLIAGVVTDEGVRRYKKTQAFIPFEERLEMVKSCRYVDEAVEIPLNYNDTRDAYRLYHFDVQFSGSDYADDPAWLGKKEFLQEHGADLVFFPYTESTSSSKIKSLIEKRLL